MKRPLGAKTPVYPAPILFLLAALLFCSPDARADVAEYRTGKPEARIAGVPDEIRQAIFTHPKETIDPLVRWLVRDVKGDFRKVKILHDWIADNIDYDVDAYLAGRPGETSWQETLSSRKAFCQGYAELFQTMCQIAGIPCEVVSGTGRGYGFAIGRAENVREPNHAWNAVKIQERWYLVDVTWDAGHIEGKAYHKQYGTAYLFAGPRQFLHTHFPSDAKWQLLERPSAVEEFAELPYLEGRFFEQGLQLATPLRRLQPAGDSVQFTLTVPENILLTVQLEGLAGAGADKLKGRTLIRRDRKGANVLATFPKAGRWGVKLFTKARNDPDMYWQAGVLEFQASAGTEWTFAETYSSVGAMDSYLESPLYVPLPAGKAQEFKIRVHGAEQVQLRIGQKKWIPMERAADDAELYRVTATVPESAGVQIVARADGGRQHVLDACRFYAGAEVDFIDLYAAIVLATVLVLVVIAWRIISLFGLWRGLFGGIIVPVVLMGLTIAATIQAKPASQGVALTVMGIFALVTAMTLLPRAQANLLRPKTRN